MTTIELLRYPHLGGYAIFDLVASFLGIYLFSPWLSKIFLKIKVKVPKSSWIFLTLPISIFVHLLVGSATQMTQDFFNPSTHYFLKIFILALLFFGLKDIKKIS